METQEILFQRKIIIKEKVETIPPIKKKVVIMRRCNERPGKIRKYTPEEIHVENLKRLNFRWCI